MGWRFFLVFRKRFRGQWNTQDICPDLTLPTDQGHKYTNRLDVVIWLWGELLFQQPSILCYSNRPTAAIAAFWLISGH